MSDVKEGVMVDACMCCETQDPEGVHYRSQQWNNTIEVCRVCWNSQGCVAAEFPQTLDHNTQAIIRHISAVANHLLSRLEPTNIVNQVVGEPHVDAPTTLDNVSTPYHRSCPRCGTDMHALAIGWQCPRCATRINLS